MDDPKQIFGERFLTTLKGQIDHHHLIYPKLPPQGIYFESLIEGTLKAVRQPFTPIEPSTPNAPRQDIIVGGLKVSIKTETGKGTKPDRVSITKLCTTEREPWTAEGLKQRVMDHLRRYDMVLMLRAVWRPPVIEYQLLEIPMDLLKRIETADLAPVGKRSGRQSLGADVYEGTKKLFHVHFDGSDGKCQVRDLAVSDCRVFAKWEKQMVD